MQRNAIWIKPTIVTICCVMMILCLVGTGLADGLEEARRNGRLRVGIRVDFPPFGYRDARGEIQGFDADLARHLGRALFDGESDVELVPVTSGGRIPLLYSGLIDIIIAAMTITEDRQRVLEFSEPYWLSGSLLLTHQESPIQGVSDLSGSRVAVIEGAVQQKDLLLIAPQAQVVAFSDLPAALRALRGGQVDALCQDDLVTLNEARRDASLRIAGRAFLPRPYAMAVRKGEHRFRTWLNVRLEQMKRDGTLRRLRENHFAGMEDDLMPLE